MQSSHTNYVSVFMWFLLVAGLSPVAVGQFACDESVSCDALVCQSSAKWSLGVKALFLDRVEDDNRIFSSVAGNGDFDADELALGFQAGYELDGRYQLDQSNALTIRWMSIDSWSDRHRDLTGPAGDALLNSASPFNFPGITAIDGVHTASLHSFEFGISRRLTRNLRWTSGFRYLEVDDHLRFTIDSGGLPTRAGTDTQNRLYGGQIGLEGNLVQSGKWSLDGFGQIGVFGNAAKQLTSVNTGAGLVSSAGNTGRASFLGELGLTARRQMTDHLDFVTGYQVMWITSVAVASDELLAANVFAQNVIDASDSVFYHGATIGFEYRR